MRLNIDAVRSQFPSLALCDGGKPRVYLDGPAGTQVPQSVIDGISRCLIEANANLGGQFASSKGAEAIVNGARTACADLLGAKDDQTIVLGQNMTGLTKQIAPLLCSTFDAGDTIILSQIDHDANISPWLDAARQFDLKVEWITLNTQTYTLDLASLEHHLHRGARLVAVGYASNVLGTINPVGPICDMAREHGALSFVDAVHYAPHMTIDVDALGCDMLACSVYKFFGPHCAALYMRSELITKLPAQPLRPAPKTGPVRFESGTMNHEGLAGSEAAIDYLASLCPPGQIRTRRQALLGAFEAIQAYETELVWHLIGGLEAIDGITIHGITNPDLKAQRTPTVSVTHDRLEPNALAAALAAENIFSWAGHSYAIEPLSALGLLESGGVLRLGIAHYNTVSEIDIALQTLQKACSA